MKFILAFLLFLSSAWAQSVKAEKAILINPDNGAILFEKRAHEPHYPASTIKIATALFALEEKGLLPDTICVASGDALKIMHAEEKHKNPLAFSPYILEYDGILIGLKEGDQLPAEVLYHSLMLNSGNDAANVIAENASGSISNFLEELNLFLLERGLTKTQFTNPHGFYHPAHMTTPYEMAQIATWAFQSPTFCAIAGAEDFSWETEKGMVKTISNWNKLIREGKYKYPHIKWAKTGYIANAGYNLVAAAEKEGRRLIAVLYGCENRNDRYEDAIALFENAFREKPMQRLLFSKESELFSRELPEFGERLDAKLAADVEVSYFPSEEREMEAQLLWHKVQLPVEVGEEVGRLVVTDLSGNQLANVQVVSTVTVRHKLSTFLRQNRGILLALGILPLTLLIKRRKVVKR